MLLGQREQQVRRRRAPRASSNGNDCCHGNSSYALEEETGTSCGWVIVFSLIFSRTAQYCVAGFEGQKGGCPSASSATPVALPHGLQIPVDHSEHRALPVPFRP